MKNKIARETFSWRHWTFFIHTNAFLQAKFYKCHRDCLKLGWRFIFSSLCDTMYYAVRSAREHRLYQHSFKITKKKKNTHTFSFCVSFYNVPLEKKKKSVGFLFYVVALWHTSFDLAFGTIKANIYTTKNTLFIMQR